jgi:hypothetical protein
MAYDVRRSTTKTNIYTSTWNIDLDEALRFESFVWNDKQKHVLVLWRISGDAGILKQLLWPWNTCYDANCVAMRIHATHQLWVTQPRTRSNSQLYACLFQWPKLPKTLFGRTMVVVSCNKVWWVYSILRRIASILISFNTYHRAIGE